MPSRRMPRSSPNITASTSADPSPAKTRRPRTAPITPQPTRKEGQAMPQLAERNADASVLKTLRDLVPRRPLSFGESLRVAELQANRLLELFAISGPLVPNELVSELPRIEVRYDADLPVSGS